MPVDLTKNKLAHGRHWKITTWKLLETLLLAFLIFMAARAASQNFRVEGHSMEPGLESGEYLIVNKLAYATIDLDLFNWVPFFDPGDDSIHHIYDSPERGDIIVFQSTQNPAQDFIKRVIGTPGDLVKVAQGQVLLNGKALTEPYARGRTANCTKPCTWKVTDGNYFVLGDNRTGSSDSRAFGLIPEENIIGRAFLSYWPLSNAGLAPNLDDHHRE